jgi:lysophospholipase L1-like esterase
MRSYSLTRFAAWFTFFAVCSIARVHAAPAQPLPLSGSRVLILGDSITQDGRYVTFVEYYLHQFAPQSHADVISIGLSSETVSGLSEKGHPYPRPCVLERLEPALKATKPAIVFACYGMNDGIYHPSSPERLSAFKAGVRQLIDRVRAAGAKLVLITPPVFDALPIASRTVGVDAPEFGYGKPFSGYDQVLAEFAAAEMALGEPDVTVIDLHRAIAAAIAARRAAEPAFTFTRDGVHPGDAGHLLIAHTILTALGYAVPTGDAEGELSRVKSDPVFELVRARRQLRSEAWLPFVGYTRGEKFKSASVDAAEQVVAHLSKEIEQ